MPIEEIVHILTNLCQLLGGWTQGGCECGRPTPWSKFDEDTRQSCYQLLNAAVAHMEGRSNLVELSTTAYNRAMPKLPGIFNVETHVLNIHHDCSINERERIAGIVRECYDYIAGQLRQ